MGRNRIAILVMNSVLIENSLLQSASYIIGKFLIDCGDGDAILKVADEYNIKITGIFLTHCHQDHIYGIPKVMSRFPKAKIYCSQMTHKGLNDEHLNLMYIMPEYAYTFEYNDNVVELTEGMHLIEGVEIEMIICNGHSNDCQSFIIGDNIFTGDAFIPFAKVFAKWPTSNKKFAIESEQKLLQIAKHRNLTIRPGHWQ